MNSFFSNAFTSVDDFYAEINIIYVFTNLAGDSVELWKFLIISTWSYTFLMPYYWVSTATCFNNSLFIELCDEIFVILVGAVANITKTATLTALLFLNFTVVWLAHVGCSIFTLSQLIELHLHCHLTSIFCKLKTIAYKIEKELLISTSITIYTVKVDRMLRINLDLRFNVSVLGYELKCIKTFIDDFDEIKILFVQLKSKMFFFSQV